MIATSMEELTSAYDKSNSIVIRTLAKMLRTIADSENNVLEAIPIKEKEKSTTIICGKCKGEGTVIEEIVVKDSTINNGKRSVCTPCKYCKGSGNISKESMLVYVDK